MTSPASAPIIVEMASGVYLRFFDSFVFGTPSFPLSDVPLQQIAADAAAGRLDVKPGRIFGFDEIREVHRAMEANQAGGKNGRRSPLIDGHTPRTMEPRPKPRLTTP
jgi:hypothetical protein